jgi:hypothetical protein
MRFLVLALALLLAAPATAQNQRQLLIDILGEVHQSDEVRRGLQSMGFNGENFEIALAHVKNVLTDRVVAGYLADNIRTASRAGKMTAEEFETLLFEPTDLGTAHLATGDQAFFLKVVSAMVKALSPCDCGRLARDRLSPAAERRALSAVLARLDPKSLKRFYDIDLKATRLGISRGARQLSKAQQSRGEAAFTKALIKGLGQSDHVDELIATIENLDRASDANACKATILLIDSVLALKGRDQADALLYFMVQ